LPERIDGAIGRLFQERPAGHSQPPAKHTPQQEDEPVAEPINPESFLTRSFSQCGEDVFLLLNFFGETRNGFYVDVGAHHPYRFSNTALLHERGWSGLNIDMDARAIAAFRACRPNDINVLGGVGEFEEEKEVYIFEEGAVSTLSAAVAEHQSLVVNRAIHKQDRITVRPLRTLLAEHMPAGTEIDLLDVDVEGLDLQVLRSNDWSRFRPNVVLVETHGATFATLKDHEVTRYLNDQGYEPVGLLTVTAVYRRVR